MSSRPVDPGADYAIVMDGLDLLTVQQIDAGTGAILATSLNVVCLKRLTKKETVSVGEGEVGSTVSGFTLVASGLSFIPKDRDRVIDADGVVWEIGNVTIGGFDTLYQCADCLRKR
ncbi:MAG: hypothetical protein C0467_25285 [Planctomycetaceae bacterium]|nr:hypothetical protein [Planctomycetaceae bacterium]